MGTKDTAAAPVDADREVVQLATAARLYDTPQATLTYWIRTGLLPAYKMGRRNRLKIADLNALLRPAERDEVADEA